LKIPKLRTLTGLQRIVRAERAHGRTIVLANGGFDLIHVGHVRYLREAKRCGDILLVALNSDDSLRRLKGPGRPILPQDERAEILASFAVVDFILIFDEPDVGRILRTLRPDIHAKGSDYTKETVPERAIVRGYGGSIAITGGPKIRSTSEIIPRILAKLKSIERPAAKKKSFTPRMRPALVRKAQNGPAKPGPSPVAEKSTQGRRSAVLSKTNSFRIPRKKIISGTSVKRS